MLRINDVKVTGTAWSGWAGVKPRAAQSWLSGERVAPAWAVFLAAHQINPDSPGDAAGELLAHLARAYVSAGCNGNEGRQERLEATL